MTVMGERRQAEVAIAARTNEVSSTPAKIYCVAGRSSAQTKLLRSCGFRCLSSSRFLT